MKKLLVLWIMILIAVAFEGLIYWGLGALVCKVFALNFSFKFIHGLVIALIIIAIKGINNKK